MFFVRFILQHRNVNMSSYLKKKNGKRHKWVGRQRANVSEANIEFIQYSEGLFCMLRIGIRNRSQRKLRILLFLKTGYPGYFS